LDLRDNSGGNNPNWFLDWWAPAGWTDRFVSFRLDEELRNADARRKAGVSMGDVAGAWYVRELDAHKGESGAFTAPRPFFCRASGCDWNNHYEPAHRVTTRPVALLVGPTCMSSCDSVALAFDENEFGPLVGEPTAAAYTMSRRRVDVTDARGNDLGFITLAATIEKSGKTGAEIESVPLHVDYPVPWTFEKRDKHDAALVDAALRGFREFKFAR
jgi:hypothetical protein